MNQFNTIIISLVIASLFQIFSFHNLICNKRYVDCERNFGKFLGHNKMDKYHLVQSKTWSKFLGYGVTRRL